MSRYPADQNGNPNARTSFDDPLLRRAVRTIHQYTMLRPGDRVLVGVSAGPDSVVLLDVLHTLSPILDIRLWIAHLDHGLRPDAAGREAELVQELAQRFALPCHMDKLGAVRKQGSLEEQLRHMRYAFFERTAADYGCNKIALGHHADDNAEAVLMHMLRGSGLRGLSGIPPIRDGRIIRPLITTRRNEILDYAQRRGLRFLQDTSNKDMRFARNRIRHHLLPRLQQFNPKLIDTLNRTAALCREEEEWLTLYVQPLLAETITRSETHLLELNQKALAAQPKTVQRHLVRTALRQWQGHLRRLGADHIEALLALADTDKQGRRMNLPGSVLAESIDNTLRFHRVADPRTGRSIAATCFYHYIVPEIVRTLELPIPEADCTLRFTLRTDAAAGVLPLTDDRTILLDMDRLMFPLIVRNWRPGDRFRPFGLQGTQKIKDLFINRKIRRAHRATVPLLLSGDMIVWVVGVRRGSQAAIAPTSRRILCVEAVEP